MNRPGKASYTTVFTLMIIISVGGLLQAQEESPNNDETDLSLEELINIKVVVASKTEENVSDAPGVISVITQDELKRFGGTTLGDVLKRVPSFLGATIYLTDRSVIAPRGDQILTSSSHLLLLINGRPMREVMEGGIKSEVYESFPVNVIDRIEVIRGPGSVLYGSQAFSAVINVITKGPENNTVSVSGALGEHLHNNGMVDLQYKIGDFGIVGAFRYADKGGWKVDWEAPGLPPAPESPPPVYTNREIIPDYGPGSYLELSFKDLRLMSSYNQWTNQNFTPDIQWMTDVPEMGVSDISNPVVWKKLFGDLGYKLNPVEWYSTTVNFTYTRSWWEVKGFPWTSRDAFEILGEWTNFFAPVKNLNIILGGTAGHITGIEKDASPDPSLSWNGGIYNKGHFQNSFSGYSQIDYRWDWCKVIGGLQINKMYAKDSLGKVDNFKADFNPRAGLIFYPLEHINIKTLYSTAYRAPSINELYLDYAMMGGKMVRRDDMPWYPGHKYNLDPEKIYTFDVGINYQDEQVQFGINGYHSRMKNLISTRAILPDFLVWDNIREANIFGLECEGKYYLTESLLFEGSFLFQRSKDEKTGEENVAPLPNFSVKGGLSYQSEFGLTLSAFNTFQQALDPKYDSGLNTTTKHFNMTNVHCSYDLNKLFQFPAAKELSLVVNVDNLLDEQIWLPPWGCLNGSRIPYNQGRTIYGGFRVAL